MADGRGSLPEPTRRAIDELRRLQAPPSLLHAAVAEASRTPQRRPTWRMRVTSAVWLATAAAAVLVAIAILPRLGILAPAASSATGLHVDLRIQLADGAYPASADAQSVWLGNDMTGVVSRVDAASGAMSGEVAVNAPTSVPYSLWPVVDGASVWAAGHDDRSIVRLDARTLEVVSRWGVGGVPYRIAPAGDVLWVSDFDGDRVLAVDATDGTILGTVDVVSPTGIAATPTAIYVVGYLGDLTVIDPTSRSVSARYPVGGRGTDARVVKGNLLIWGPDRGLEAFDLGSATIVASQPGVTGLALLHGDIWAALQGGSVSRLDGATLEPSATIVLGAVSTDQLVASSDRLWAYAETDGGPFLLSIRLNP